MEEPLTREEVWDALRKAVYAISNFRHHTEERKDMLSRAEIKLIEGQHWLRSWETSVLQMDHVQQMRDNIEAGGGKPKF